MKSKLFFAFLAFMIAQAAAAETIPLRIGFIPVLGTSQIFVADQLGMLKAAAFTARFTNFESGPVMIQALASGTLDIYVGGVAPLAVARSKGVEVKVVAATAIEEMTVTIGGKFAPYFKTGISSADAFKAFHAATGERRHAAFLGATSVRPGRFNVVGTLLAIFFLAAAITGLTFAGVQDYINDLFTGFALVLAVGVSVLLGRRRLGAR